MHAHHLGQTVMHYRKSQKMTIREFAEYSGISTSLISQIERGQANPSLNVLELISKALNVPIYTLFINDINTDTLISRKKDRNKIYREDARHTVYDVLTPDFMKANIEVLMMDLKPNGLTTNSHYSHSDKEEIAIIMNGQITVDLNGKKYNLKEGDVVRIPPKLKHRFINMNDQVATVLFILTPSLI